MDNKQTFLNFSRNYNIIGGDEDDNNNKEEALNDTSKDNFVGTAVPKRLEKKDKKLASKMQRNPYLKKAETENKLIKITQPRLLLTAAAAAHKK